MPAKKGGSIGRGKGGAAGPPGKRSAGVSEGESAAKKGKRKGLMGGAGKGGFQHQVAALLRGEEERSGVVPVGGVVHRAVVNERGVEDAHVPYAAKRQE